MELKLTSGQKMILLIRVVLRRFGYVLLWVISVIILPVFYFIYVKYEKPTELHYTVVSSHYDYKDGKKQNHYNVINDETGGLKTIEIDEDELVKSDGSEITKEGQRVYHDMFVPISLILFSLIFFTEMSIISEHNYMLDEKNN